MNAMIGQSLGHYRIESKLGEGGMGVVYRAFDTHLDRPVAIKILRADTNTSPDRKRRFVQEAKAASALNHPNIVHIYDISSSDGIDYIAMEFVAGKTLDQWIGKSGMPLKDALKYSIQIADALARAHAAGIVHRDLKPANIIVGDDGRVKLVDFGLAKLTEPAPDPDDATATMTAQQSAQTEEGTIVGTVAYMSPEQAEGKKVDARSDIFSFGSMLYEMIAGRRPFQAATKMSTISAILTKDPEPLGNLVPNLPAELEKIILRSLRKDPDRRAQHIGDLKLALEELRDESQSGRVSSASKTGTPVRARSSRALAARLAASAVLLAAIGAIWWLKRSHPIPGRNDWVKITDFADSVSQPALSPDGRMLTFIRGPNTFRGPGQIYVKLLPSGDPVQLTHDELAKMSPVFSPDGSRIAYTIASSHTWDTWVVPVLGGEPRLWLPNASGLIWIDKSRLLFSEIKDKYIHMGLVTAAESLAESRDLYLPPNERGMVHRSYPSPDGKSILLVEMIETGGFGPCRLLPFGGPATGKLVGPPGAQCTFAAWSPDGTWMYFSSDAGGVFHTWRQRFPDGEPEQITSGPTEEEGIAFAPDGRSFFTAVGVKQSSVWLHDTRGDRQISLEGQAIQPRFTPDGKKLCYLIRSGSSYELSVADLESNHSERLLPGVQVAAPGPTGAWGSAYDISADSRQVAFFSPRRDGKLELWVAALDRTSPPRRVPGVRGDQPAFGPDGEILFRKIDGASAFLYSVRQDGTGLRKLSESRILGVFGPSPDRQWVLIGQLGQGEVIFPIGPGSPIVTHLGPPYTVKWSGDGKNLLVGTANEGDGRTYVLPLPAGELVPGRAANGRGFPSEPEWAKLSGGRIIPVGEVAPGATADVYAFTRQAVQRNLYRIPLP